MDFGIRNLKYWVLGPSGYNVIYTIPYYSIPYCIIYTILYYSILYHTILFEHQRARHLLLGNQALARELQQGALGTGLARGAFKKPGLLLRNLI